MQRMEGVEGYFHLFSYGGNKQQFHSLETEAALNYPHPPPFLQLRSAAMDLVVEG